MNDLILGIIVGMFIVIMPSLFIFFYALAKSEPFDDYLDDDVLIVELRPVETPVMEPQDWRWN